MGGDEKLEIDVILFAVVGFFSGFGTTFGTELGKYLIQRIKERRSEHERIL